MRGVHPKKQDREYYEVLGHAVPTFINLDSFREEIMGWLSRQRYRKGAGEAFSLAMSEKDKALEEQFTEALNLQEEQRNAAKEEYDAAIADCKRKYAAK